MFFLPNKSLFMLFILTYFLHFASSFRNICNNFVTICNIYQFNLYNLLRIPHQIKKKRNVSIPFPFLSIPNYSQFNMSPITLNKSDAPLKYYIRLHHNIALLQISPSPNSYPDNCRNLWLLLREHLPQNPS